MPMIIGGMACLSFLFLATASATPAASPVGMDRSTAKPPYIRIDQRQARDIAWDYGITRIEEMALSGSRWEIAGRDSEDEEIALDIDAHSGEVSR
ncbi:hypothetical protein DWF00_09000 [Bosea caraganae]|uniref:PepSY domain-containing protein n=1 Tax=Bosea caraganae TaxID=2763117 RepID=A0A370LB07_9HYPH|nr:PepSY domain-containing protein [Bosea caraganae]RDJ27130.1 hypothetical protein DWF00_09000 [Bosea caraganae]RDJ29147.1 hypothetical protein DWE98_00775 [Bosea caraganae]